MQTDLQKDVVVAVARSVSDDWERIIASYEVDFEHGRVDNLLIAYVKKAGDKFVSDSVESIPQTVNQAFFALRDAVSGEKWNVAEVTVDSDGAYKFSFSYEPAKRINGVFDYESYDKFGDCASIYEAEKLRG